MTSSVQKPGYVIHHHMYTGGKMSITQNHKKETRQTKHQEGKEPKRIWDIETTNMQNTQTIATAIKYRNQPEETQQQVKSLLLGMLICMGSCNVCERDCEDEIKKRDVGHIVGCPMHCGVPTRCPIDKWHGGQPASPLSHCHSALQCHIMPFHTPRAILYHAMPYKTAPYHTEFHFIWNHHCHHCIVTVFCAEETDQNRWVQS